MYHFMYFWTHYVLDVVHRLREVLDVAEREGQERHFGTEDEVGSVHDADQYVSCIDLDAHNCSHVQTISQCGDNLSVSKFTSWS